MNISQIIRNGLTNYGRMFLTLALSFVLTPIIIAKLGAEAFGIWAILQSIAAYFALADGGIAPAAARYVAFYRGRQDWEGLNRHASCVLFIYLWLAAFALLMGIGLANCGVTWFKVSAANAHYVPGLLFVAGLIAAVGFIGCLPIQCVIAAQKLDSLNVSAFVLQLVMGLVSLVGILMGGGIMVLSLTQLVSAVFNVIIGFCLCRRYLPQVRLVPQWNYAEFKLLFSLSSCAFLITVSKRFIYQTDSLVIASILSTTAVAGYTVALKAAGLIPSLVDSGTSVLGTFASEQDSLGNRSSLKSLWLHGSKFALALGLPFCVLFIACGNTLLRAWVDSVGADAVLCLSILTIGKTVDSFQSSAYQIMLNAGAHRSLTVVLGLEAVCNFLLSIVLARTMGIVGVALGTAIPQTLRSLIFYIWYMFKFTDTGPAEFLSKVVWPAICAALPAISLALLCQYIGLPATKTCALLVLGVISIVSAIGVVMFGLGKSARQALFAALVRKRLMPQFVTVPGKSTLQPVQTNTTILKDEQELTVAK